MTRPKYESMERFFNLSLRPASQQEWHEYYHDEWKNYAEETGSEGVTEAVNTVLADRMPTNLGNPIHEIISGALKGSNYED